MRSESPESQTHSPLPHSQTHSLCPNLAHLYLHMVLCTWSPCPGLAGLLLPTKHFLLGSYCALLYKTCLLSPQSLPVNKSPRGLTCRARSGTGTPARCHWTLQLPSVSFFIKLIFVPEHA